MKIILKQKEKIIFVEFKTLNGKDTFILNAFQIISVVFTAEGHIEFITTDNNRDVLEKLETI